MLYKINNLIWVFLKNDGVKLKKIGSYAKICKIF